MIVREGSQLGAMIVAASCMTLTLISGPTAGVAAQDAPGNRVELPREILPWRRDVERHAASALAKARKSLAAGNTAMAERQLRELIKAFPGTHAAADGQGDLFNLRERQHARVQRNDLGIEPPLQGDSASRLSPVAGWQTSVRSRTSDLREALIEAAGDRVFFDDGSAKLSSRAIAVLKKQARWLKTHDKLKVRIAGHADDRGSSHSNVRLSHDRAATVRKFLINKGISPKRLKVFGHGRARPIAICDVRTCSAQNRRVVTELRSTDSAFLQPD